jgi:hypothetical protein
MRKKAESVRFARVGIGIAKQKNTARAVFQYCMDYKDYLPAKKSVTLSLCTIFSLKE